MKNIIYPFITLVAAAAALVSCTREETEVNDQTEFVYRFELVEGETKATLDDQGVWWEADKDHVGVIVGNENIEASVEVSEGKKVISFTSASAIEEGTPIYSYYPYSEAVSSAEEAQVTIPTEQEGGSVSAMPMAGIPIHLESAAGAASNGTINFMNLGAIIEFRVYSTNADYANETVESVAFWSDSEEQKVSGTAPIDLTDVAGGDEPSAPTIVLGTPSYRRATVTQSASVAANKENATPIYLVVAPGTFASGKIVVNTNAASYTFTYTNKAFARNSFKKFSMNLGGGNVVRDAMTKTYTNIGTNQLSEGTYLLVAYDNSSSGDGAGTYICWIPNTGNGSAHQDRQVISHIKYSGNNESSVASDGLENRSGDIIGSEVIIEQYDNKWLVKVKNTGQYLYCPNENYKIGFTTDKSLAGHTWTLNGSNIYFDSGDYHFYHSGSEKGFSYRTTAESPYSYNVRFYKLSGSTKSQTISFEGVPDGGYTWDIGENTGTYTKPNLVGAKTTVLYESSNPAIANVDTMTGDVSFGSQTGTVTITATAAGEDGYASATASYQIAVSNSSIPVSVYNKVTSVSDLEPGAKYLLVFEGLDGDTDGDGDPKVFSAVLNGNGTEFLKNASAALDVTIANGVIESSEFDDCQFTLEAGYYLKGDKANKYIYPGLSGSSSVMLAENLSSHALTIAINNDGIAEIENGGRYLVWSTSNHYFSCNADVSGQYSTGICLYKLDDGLQSQTLVFSVSEAKYDQGTGEWTVAVPTVSGNKTTPLTWISFDEAVATVDASGNVTPGAKGTTTIKVTAPANETYRSGSASFTVTVFNSNVPTYYKVDEIENTQEYIIVSNGYALVLNGTTVSASAVAAGDAEGEVKFDASSSAIWTATVNGSSVKVKNGNNYLRTSSRSASFSIGTSDSNNAIVYSSENNTIKVGNYYLNYSGSSFSLNSSATNTSAAFYSRTKPLPSLKFDKAGVVYDLAINDWIGAMPVLSPANADVSYGYNGDAGIIKSITAAGVITLEDNPEKGQVTVTATANTPGDYNVASASYTITVLDSSDIPTYTKVSEITSGATYLIVSTDANSYNGNGQKRAFKGDTSGTAVEVDGTSGTITGDYSACEFVITAEGEDYSLLGPSGYVTGQSTTDPYIQVSETKVTMSLTDAATLKAAASSDGLVSDAFYFYYTKTSTSYGTTTTSTEALYLNSNGKFKIGGSGRKYGVYLYKKN